MAALPQILALDFDGVLLDGLVEYFQTAWQAYCQIWQPATTQPPADTAQRFYRLRPVIESGWEMPVLVWAILQGADDAEILANWPARLATIVEREALSRTHLVRTVDSIRDRWIADDLDGWLAIQSFYPGTIARLQQFLSSGMTIYIVSTKEGRFIHQLLQRAGVQLPREQIFGKEVRQPKPETLRQILQTIQANPKAPLWFVEDRLKALQAVRQQSDLAEIGLFLATWGYNTEQDRQTTSRDRTIQALTLPQFCQPLPQWRSLPHST